MNNSVPEMYFDEYKKTIDSRLPYLKGKASSSANEAPDMPL